MSKKNGKKKVEAARKGSFAVEAQPYEESKPTHEMSPNFTVARIEAATMITLACNTVSDMLNTDEGTPSRNACVRACDKTFADMEKASIRCEKEGADDALAALRKGNQAYAEYKEKHEAAEKAPKDSPEKEALIKEAAAATEHLADVMNEILHAF